MPYLRYIDDYGDIQTQRVPSSPLIIGRAPECQITLDSDMISREHAKIEPVSEGRYRIRDLGSRNKTHVSGQLIAETHLVPGDIIRVGDRVLEFVDEEVRRERIDLDFITPDRNEPAHSQWIKTKRPVSLTVKQLEDLARLAGGTRFTARPEDIADMALGQVILDVVAERGFVAVKGEGKRELRPIAHRSLKKPPSGSLMPVSQSFIFPAILQSVAGRYPESAGQIDEKQGYAATGMVAPLTRRGEVMGVIYVDRPSAKKVFSESALMHLASAGAQVGTLMAESTRRLLAFASREEAGWMTTLRQMQKSLESAVSSSDAFEVARYCHPGRARCGDFVEVIHLDEGRCAVLAIDGGGHGVAGLAQAAAIVAAVRSALAVSEDVLMDPGIMFDAINRRIANSSSRQVVPCTYLGIDQHVGRIAYINAGGMPPILMVAPGRLITLDQSALVLGVEAKYDYEVTQVDLPDHCRLVCYTDGLTEATNAAGEALGSQRLHETLLDQDSFGPAPNVLEKIKDTFKTHLAGSEPDDDASVVVLSRGG